MKLKNDRPKSFAQSFAQMVRELVERVAEEGREYAAKLGLKGPNLHQQVKDEIEWWEEKHGLDYFEWDNPPASSARWRRVRALHGIDVALDVLRLEDGPIEMWTELVDDYLPEMRRYANAAAGSGPDPEEMARFSAVLRARENACELEIEAESKIAVIKEQLAKLKRLACAA